MCTQTFNVKFAIEDYLPGVLPLEVWENIYQVSNHDELARQRDLGLINLPKVIIGERSPAVNPRHPTPRRRLNNDGNDHEEAQSLSRRLIAAGNATMRPDESSMT